MVFHKNGALFLSFITQVKWRSIYLKFLSDVAEDTLIQILKQNMDVS